MSRLGHIQVVAAIVLGGLLAAPNAQAAGRPATG
jgi:hypothetical protein